MRVSTVAEMRALDQAAVEEFGIRAELLMENAGQAVAHVIAREHGIDGRRFVIFCGVGHNGGDGLVVARLLHANGGEVRVFVLGNPDRYDGPARVNYDIVSGLPLEMSVPASAREAAAVEQADAIVDAILGTGVAREITGLFREIIELINASGRPVFSVDIPSGVNGDRTRTMKGMNSGDINERNGPALLDVARRTSIVVIGSTALSYGEAEAVVRRLVAQTRTPLVLTGAVITSFDWLAPVLNQRRATTIVILDRDDPDWISGHASAGAGRIETLRQLSCELDAVAVVGNPRALVAFPDGRVAINLSGSRAGAVESSDVLAGVIAAMTGLEPELDRAIRKAVFVTGLACGLALEPEPARIVTSRNILSLLPRAATLDLEDLDVSVRDHYRGGRIV